MTIPIIVIGAFGRMGEAVIDAALKDSRFSITAAVVRPASSPQQAKAWPFPIHDTLESALLAHKTSIIIDFSLAELLPEHLKIAQRFSTGIVIATTGHSETHQSAITASSHHIPVLVAPNTSLMANLCMALSRMAASTLKRFDAGVLDIHHRHKKDAPSGTAKALVKAIQEGSPHQEVSVSSLRLGHTIGEHTAYFFNDFERLELTHRVMDRRVFAEGALLAAQFLFDRAPGLYGMNDVLELNMTIEK